MCPIILLIITDIIQPGLDLQQLWQLAFIVPIIGATMVVTMVVIMVVVVIIMAVITLSLIPGTGIKLIITTIAETHPILCPITGLKVIMAPDQQTGLTLLIVRPRGRLIARPRGRPIVLRREHPIFHPEAHLTGHPQVRPTGPPQAHLTGPPQQTFLQEDQVVPGVVEVIVEVEVE